MESRGASSAAKALGPASCQGWLRGYCPCRDADALVSYSNRACFWQAAELLVSPLCLVNAARVNSREVLPLYRKQGWVRSGREQGHWFLFCPVSRFSNQARYTDWTLGASRSRY